MKKIIGHRFSFAFISLVVASLLITSALPASASAAVQTAQLIPPGGNECVQIPVHNFTPYIYGGALHSFEFTVPDGAYVGISGSVGETAIPYSQITRRIEPSGALRIHVDTPTTPIHGTLNIGITMLSSKGHGEPVCVSIFSTGLAIDGSMHAPAPAPKPAPSPSPVPAPVVTPKPVAPTPEPQAPTPAPQTKPTTTQVGPTATSVSPFTSVQKALKDICGDDSNALRLWIVLLIVYALIVLAAIFGQSKLPAALQTQEWVATAIVVPFLLLFALWYFAEACRSSAWIPVVATVIALAGLSAAFWERKGPTVTTTTNVINLPSAKK